MDFRTLVPPRAFGLEIGHNTPSLVMGSCFAESIGGRMQELKFPVVANPFGILFNPLSLASAIARLLEGTPFQPGELELHNGRWLSFAHHGQFSGADREEVLGRINLAFAEGKAQIQQAGLLILTLGTSFVWEIRGREAVAANCHKLPASMFVRRRASLEDLTTALSAALDQLIAARPDIRILLTVSPIRHLRDGLIENQRSKAALLLACSILEDRIPNVRYFPAYELLMDDLRDYRYYARDMIHPSEMAQDYIWDYFSRSFFSENTLRLIREVEKVRQAMQHRPLRPDSPEHQAFRQRQRELILALETAWPELDWQMEKSFFS
ncbi:MAG: GSCFA domain-containing protein [Haliscomenobacter sp.]|nr:GSCFA domain-containing protein [Haliscomenobacter sp.]